MNELRAQVNRLLKVMCYLLALFVLGWGFTAYKAIFAGLLLGTIVSFGNALYTAFKAHQFSKRIAAGLKPGGSGMLTRFSIVALAALLAIHYSDIFHIPSFMVGLITAPAVLFVGGLVDGYRLRNTGSERREK